MRLRGLSQIFFVTAELVEPDDISVVLPRITRPLTNAQYNELLNSVDVLEYSPSDGIDIYGRAMRFVRHCIQA